MKLKESIDVISFFEKARECTGNVFFHSDEGDILNIKSTLSQYILVSVLCNPDFLKKGRVICTQEEDYQFLSEYLVLQDI